MAPFFDEPYQGIKGNHMGKTFDPLMELWPVGHVLDTTPSKPIYLGEGLIDADLVIDSSNVVGTNLIQIQLAWDEDFTDPAGFDLTQASIDGRIFLPFRNTRGDLNGPYPWMRLIGVPSFNPPGGCICHAWVAKK